MGMPPAGTRLPALGHRKYQGVADLRPPSLHVEPDRRPGRPLRPALPESQGPELPRVKTDEPVGQVPVGQFGIRPSSTTP